MGLTRTQTGLWAAAGLAAAAWSVAGWPSLGAYWSNTILWQFAPHPEFRLEDARGDTVTQADFRGRYLLVFFGFTRCQDICPTTLAEVGDVMENLGADADDVQPLFISLDPERSRIEDLARYTAAFHPTILGLTGVPEATRAAAESFHVLYELPAETGSPEGQNPFHSSSLFLVGPDGGWLRVFDGDTPAAKIIAELKARL